MITDSQRFIGGLEHGNRSLIRAMPKSDLHSHAGLGFHLEVLERWAERTIAPPPMQMESLHEMDSWIRNELQPLYSDPKCVAFVLRAPFAEAWHDGITLLEMSFDITFITRYQNNPGSFAEAILAAHRLVAPEITFRPELGIPRDLPPEKWLPVARECIDTGLFCAIDLYGTEEAQPPGTYQELFRYAGAKGLKRKVHLGEFGTAQQLLHAVKILQPDAIQHGIAAAQSPEAMEHLRRENITLNICPTSNLRMGRVNDLASHPIRTLFREGVSVTINSDDIMVFGQNVSDEYNSLFCAGTLTATELNSIRLNGLNQ